MVKCQKCGEEVNDAKFCPKCGTKVEAKVAGNSGSISKFCPKCGNRLGSGDSHCPNCGERITSNAESNSINSTAGIQSKFCHNCGTKINKTASICPSCGVDVSDSPQTSMEGGNSLNEMVGGDFRGIIKFAIISTVGILIVSSILFYLMGFWIFSIMLLVVVLLGSVLFNSPKEAAIYGGIIGLIVGLLQNHIISFLTGLNVNFITRILIGDPLFGYILSGIILGVIGCAFLKKTSIGKSIERALSKYRPLLL